MKSPNKRVALTCTAACALLTSIVLSCGLDWPDSILDNREANLLNLTPMDWLSTQIEDLVPPSTDSLRARENDVRVTTEVAERRDVDNLHAAQLQSMRSARSGEVAYEIGQGLPDAVRLYVSGAVEYHHARDLGTGGEASASAARAVSYFKSVLALASDSRASRATWASYMAAEATLLVPSESARTQALAYYAQTRDLARQGLADPLGLAVSSYGEEARLELRAGNIPKAVELYLEQAARGSENARLSLRQVAHRLMDDPELAARFINDPRVQRLWFAAALAEGRYKFELDTSDSSGDESQTATDDTAEAPAAPPAPPDDGAQSDGSVPVVPALDESADEQKIEEELRARRALHLAQKEDDWSTKVTKVTAKIDTHRVSQLDQLAALAYGLGQYDLAARLAKDVATPMASVVRAKLALRAGDRGSAAQEYAAAVAGREQARTIGDQRISADAWDRVLAEHGVLAISRGDYAQALQSLLEAGDTYWQSAAYIAERVLTLDELVQFAHDHVPPGTPAIKKTRQQELEVEADTTDQDDNTIGVLSDQSYASTSSTKLRLLLARRLMRAGRLDEALVDFRNNSMEVGEKQEDLAAVSLRYVQALHDGEHAWSGVQRAQALFDAATLARTYGMELLGYELAPDFYIVGGITVLEQDHPEGPYAGPDEARRFEASAPTGIRFHYRSVAAELARKAADNLPPRSQAFAAALCQGVTWTVDRDHGRAVSLYKKYVQEGAYVGWSKRFGGRCQAPDFKRAEALLWKQRSKAVRAALRPYKFSGPAVIVCGAVALGVWITRRRRAGDAT